MELPEINLGSEICKSLKKIYFTEIGWVDCYKQIGSLFTQLKQKAKIYYPDVGDIEVLKHLRSWSEEDIRELLA